MKERRGGHLSDLRNNPRCQWIQELLDEGKAPIMFILERVRPARDWPLRERHWIAEGRRLGWPLTNVSDGGDGGPDFNNDSMRGKTRRKPAPKGARPTGS